MPINCMSVTKPASSCPKMICISNWTACKKFEKFEKEIEMDDELASDLAAVELELAEQSFSDNEEDVVSGDTD